jgi:glycosyltransferase involved in cell wall biosynthesis
MKVLHVIPSLAKRYGGPSTALPPLVNDLRHRGLDVDIAATDADGPSENLTVADLPPEISNAYMFSRSYSEQWKISTTLWHWLDKHVCDYDIVHIHALWSFSTAVAARSCRKHNIPYIVRSAGMLSSYSWLHKGWKKHIYWHLLEKKTIKHAAAFHATSQGEKRDIVRLHPDARVFVIPNGVESTALSLPTGKSCQTTTSSFVIEEKLPIILFLSRLHPKKGIVDRMLPAFAKMNTKAHLLIAGGEDSHYPGHKEEIVKTIHSLNIFDSVNLIDAVDGDDRWGLFDKAKLFVLPSHSENFGIVVVEAMARGCPVIVSKDVQAAPLVEQASAGMIVSGDVDELTCAMDKMISDPVLAQQMGNNGRCYAQENLRWDMIGQQVESMYSSVLT